MYASLAQTLNLGNLKPEGYELISLPYDFHCPSVKGAGGSNYTYAKIRDVNFFTTLDLAKKHAISSGHGVTVSRETEFPKVLDRDGLRLF